MKLLALKLLLGKMLCENFKEKNKNSICSELPKIAMLPKKHFGPLNGNIHCGNFRKLHKFY